MRTEFTYDYSTYARVFRSVFYLKILSTLRLLLLTDFSEAGFHPDRRSNFSLEYRVLASLTPAPLDRVSAVVWICSGSPCQLRWPANTTGGRSLEGGSVTSFFAGTNGPHNEVSEVFGKCIGTVGSFGLALPHDSLPPVDCKGVELLLRRQAGQSKHRLT